MKIRTEAQVRAKAAARRCRRAGLALALAMGAASSTGCGREFFREWADQDVSEAVFEKSRDPRFRLDFFSIEPPAMLATVERDECEIKSDLR